MLKSGGKFAYRALREPKKDRAPLEQWELPAAEQLIWKDLSELRGLATDEATKGKWLVPQDRSQAAVDAVRWDAKHKHYVLYNCTVASKHPLKVDAVKQTVEALGWTPEHGWLQPEAKAKTPKQNPTKARKRISFVWIVPTAVFDEWQTRQLLAPKQEEIAKTPALQAVEANLVQGVLGVPYSHTSALRLRLARNGVEEPLSLIKQILLTSGTTQTSVDDIAARWEQTMK